MSLPSSTSSHFRTRCIAGCARFGLVAAVTTLGVLAPTESAHAQSAPPVQQHYLRRPSLGPSADTNSAFAYYMYGRSKLRSDPREAADAYYWAIRLAPMWAQAYYGRAAALTIQNPDAVLRHFRDRDDSPDIGIATADSLRSIASVMDPFTSGASFDWQVLDALVDHMTEGRGWLIPGRRTGDPVWDAWMAESQARVGDAAREYADAIRKYPKNFSLHASRGVVLSQAGQLDSAVTEFGKYLDGARKRDTTKLVRFYRPQAYAEYALGEIQLRRGDTTAARTAFEQAVTEDLSFHMAHVRLGELAALRGDTTTALTEFETAVQLKDAAEVHIRYAEALIAMNRLAPALEQFKATTRCEPFFALPYFTIARIYDSASFPDEALQNFKLFLERASPGLDEAAYARKRVTELTAAATAGAPQ